MDEITTAITAALSAGVAAGITEAGKKAIADAYGSLKALLRRKFGNRPGAMTALAKVEDAPDSPSHVEALSKELVAQATHKDPEVLAAARKLIEAISQSSVSSNVTMSGHHNAVVAGSGNATVNDSSHHGKIG